VPRKSHQKRDRLAADGDRASPLERRCRGLLLAYPASYRRVRGEEIIGTLLEATPPGRNWPLPRDARALIAGGLHARAAVNGSRTTAANLRIAVLAGVTAYLCLNAAVFVRDLLRSDLGFGVSPRAWPALVALLAFALAIATAWTSRRRLIAVAGGLPAIAIVCYAAAARGWSGWPSALWIVLASLLLLAALGGGSERLDARWLWPLGVVAGLTILPGAWSVLGLLALVFLAVVSLAWIAVDARPALAAVVLLLGVWLPSVLTAIRFGGVQTTLLPVVPIAGLTAAAALWRLRRQSARPDPR
jgi:hypothetical protein